MFPRSRCHDYVFNSSNKTTATVSLALLDSNGPIFLLGYSSFQPPSHNIEINLKDVGWKDVDWTHLAQDRNQWQALPDSQGFSSMVLSVLMTFWSLEHHGMSCRYVSCGENSLRINRILIL
jgi:hypothetical protein